MTVYVDTMKANFGRMVMCHMFADTDEELHEMAAKIGVQRKWHQAPPKHESHYDIALSKRALAIKNGAVEVTWHQYGAMSQHRRVNGVLGNPEAAEVWSKEFWAQTHRPQSTMQINDPNGLLEQGYGLMAWNPNVKQLMEVGQLFTDQGRLFEVTQASGVLIFSTGPYQRVHVKLVKEDK